MSSDILPVIVLYKQPLCETTTYKTLLAESGLFFYVYDNSPEPVCQPAPQTFFYVHDPQNSGVSRAYNTAAGYAHEHGYRWLLLLDQDTSFPPDSLRQYQAAIAAHPDIRLFAPELTLEGDIPFSPVRYFCKTGHRIRLKRGTTYQLPGIAPVNSGVLIALELFENTGGYNEKVRLDFADFQFMETVARQEQNFFLLDVRAIQSFREGLPPLSAALTRYAIYLECAKACPRHSPADRIAFFYVVTRRALSLTWQYGHSDFLKVLFREYLCRTGKRNFPA